MIKQYFLLPKRAYLALLFTVPLAILYSFEEIGWLDGINVAFAIAFAVLLANDRTNPKLLYAISFVAGIAVFLECLYLLSKLFNAVEWIIVTSSFPTYLLIAALISGAKVFIGIQVFHLREAFIKISIALYAFGLLVGAMTTGYLANTQELGASIFMAFIQVVFSIATIIILSLSLKQLPNMKGAAA